MKKNNILFKIIFLFILIGGLFGAAFATTTQKGRDILYKLKDKGRTDEEIIQKMENLGLDYSDYFPNSVIYSTNTISTYIARNCKSYSIEYINTLGVYTSSDLKNREYFINTDYLKRYIDSKNPQQPNCPKNEGRINSHYDDQSNNIDRYIAPNGKIYFITNQNGTYTSNELKKNKKFGTISELKKYIKNNNPFVWMGNTNIVWMGNTKNNDTNNGKEIIKMRNEIIN